MNKLQTAYKNCMKKNASLQERVSTLEKQVYTEKASRSSLKQEIQQQRLVASDFAGRMENKIKLIREKASLLDGEEKNG